jgi:peptidoglycan/LPS O-acetylase OafA/YrhL
MKINADRAENSRLAPIDLLRFMAAIMVATHHWVFELGGKYKGIYELPVIGDLVQHGNSGVEIFFIISGFVIMGTAQRSSGIEFVFARFNRIFPGLLISMLVILPIGNYFITAYQRPLPMFFNSIFLTYTISGVEPLTVQLWTLLVEIKFYGVIALLLFVAPKIFKNPKRAVIVLLIWQIFVFLLVMTFPSEVENLNSPYVTLQRFSNLFALGICFNLLNKSSKQIARDQVIVWLANIYFLYQVFFVDSYIPIVRIYLAIASLLIVFSSYFSFSLAFKHIFYWLGLSSYLTYLLHIQVGLYIILQIQARLTSNSYICLILAISLLTFVSILLAKFVERPIQRCLKTIFLKANSPR